MSEPASADAGLRSSLLAHVAGAVGLVVLAAALFWAIGSIGDEDAEVPTAAEAPDADDLADDDDPTDVEDEGDDPGEDVDEPTGTDDTDADEGPDEDADDATDEADETEEADDDDADDDGSAEDADAGDEPTTPRIDPSTISVQVLDGYQQDGGAAADAVQQQLTDEGYDIVARNPALRYDETTVLWTAGFEDEGRQVAADIGAAEAREQPGNLSESVAVHVVVGADRG